MQWCMPGGSERLVVKVEDKVGAYAHAVRGAVQPLLQQQRWRLLWATNPLCPLAQRPASPCKSDHQPHYLTSMYCTI